MADQTLARYVNEFRILSLLRTGGQATRADIARRLSLTPATITRLITNLAARGLVREVNEEPRQGQPREPGRPGVGVAIDPGGAYFLGVEIGVGHLRMALIDLCAATVNAAEFRVSRTISPEEAVRTIADHLTLLEHDIRFRNRIRSLGVTVPGLVTSDGHVVNLPILGWKDVNLLNLLKAQINLPAFVENNANAAAFAAVYMEPAGATDSAIFLKIGTGCGGAAIVNGRLLAGSTGTAGEFGHMRIAQSGTTCDCGQVGCLETFVNLRALARAYHGTEAVSEEEFAALPGLVAARWDDGDAAAQRAAGTLGQHLGAGIASLVNIFNPAVVMLGGAMRPVLARLLPDLQRDVAAAIVPGTAIPEIRLSVHGDLECAVGAAALAHHRAFDVSLGELT